MDELATLREQLSAERQAVRELWQQREYLESDVRRLRDGGLVQEPRGHYHGLGSADPGSIRKRGT